LVAGLCTTCRGERVLVVIKFNVTFLPLRPYWKNVYLFLERYNWHLANVSITTVIIFSA